MSDQSVDLLHRWGDTIERAICDNVTLKTAEYTDPHFANLIHPYSEVWQRHILPRRSPAAMEKIDDRHAGWRKFAASHYTAVFRAYQSVRMLGRLLRACELAADGDLHAQTLIDAHDAVTGFWEHLGATIDNLAHCFDDAPGFNYRGRGEQELRQYPHLSAAYERRTQMIHHPLVPLGFEDGAITFNERHFDQAETDWSVRRYDAEWVSEFHGRFWPNVMADMVSAWRRLQDELRRADMNPPAVSAELLDPATEVPDGRMRLSGSGWLDVVQSRVTHGRNAKAGDVPYWHRGDSPPPSGFR